MSGRKLIIVETNKNSARSRSFYVKARLKDTKDDVRGDPCLLETIQTNVRAVIGHTWIDQCAFAVTIGEAWIEDWDEIEEDILRIVIAHVEWVSEEVKIVHRLGKDRDQPTTTETMRVATYDADEKAAEWVNAASTDGGD